MPNFKYTLHKNPFTMPEASCTVTSQAEVSGPCSPKGDRTALDMHPEDATQTWWGGSAACANHLGAALSVVRKPLIQTAVYDVQMEVVLQDGDVVEVRVYPSDAVPSIEKADRSRYDEADYAAAAKVWARVETAPIFNPSADR